MSMNDLVTQEEELIIQKYLIKRQLIEAEFQEKDWEIKFWTETDFSKLKLTNAEQRKAYVKGKMAKLIKRSDMYKNELELCENFIKLVRFKKSALLENISEEELKGIDFSSSKVIKELAGVPEGDLLDLHKLSYLIKKVTEEEENN